MRRRVLVAVVSATLACGGSDVPTAPADVNMTGTWALQSVTGASLPVIASQTSTSKVEVMSDVFAIASAGTFVETVVIRTTPTGGSSTTQTVTDAGTYAVKGNVVTLHWTSDGSTQTATVTNGTFTVRIGSVNWFYTRQ
jgi:hypothetical protein